jgi:Bacterial transcriptional regulator
MIADVRRRGVGATHGDIILGESAVAAPVFDHEGRIAACLTLLGHSGAIESNRVGAPAEALLQAARTISEQIGFWNQMPGASFAEWLDVLREAPRGGEELDRPLPPALLNPAVTVKEASAPGDPEKKRRRARTALGEVSRSAS